MVPSEPSPRPSTICILHIDDETTQLDFTKKFLEMADEGLIVESVISPEDALERLKGETFDCVVSDFMMSPMDGIEVARRIRESSDIPVILYTGRGSEEVAEAAFTVGIDDYIRKEMNPSHYQVLARRIRSAVDKKRAEDKVIQERDLAQRYLDVAAVMMVILDTEGRVMLLNQKGCEILGVSPEEALGKNWFDSFLPSPNVEEVKGVVRELMAGNIEPVKFYENPVVSSSGEERIIAWHNSLLHDDDGNISGILSSGSDITEQRRTEEKFRLILESGMDGVSIVVGDKLVYMNDRFCKMLGYDDPSELLGLESMEIVHPSSRDLLREKKRNREQGDTEPALYELEMLRKDGSTYISEALTSVIEYEGKPVRLGFNRDITERKRYEERLKALHRHVAELNKVSTMEEVYAFTLDAMERGLGFSRGALLVVEGENLTDVMLRGLNNDRPYTLPLDGKGLTVKAMRTGESVLVPDVSLDPDYIDVGVGIKSELVVPVKLYGVAVAVLNTESTELDGYTEYDQVILEILAEHVAFAMKRISDETVRERYLDGLEALHRYAPELAQAETLAEIGEKTFDAIESVLGFEFGSLSVVEGDLLRHVYIRGFEGREPLEMPLDGPGVTVRAVRTGETQLVPDTRKDEDFVPGYAEGVYEVISELAVPVKIDDEVMAVLNVGSDRVNAYDADDRRLLEILTHHVSSALDRLKRVDSLERLVKERTEELLDVEWMMAAGRVAATMAHDLRSPLQTIKNTLFLLKRSPQNASSLLERLDRAVDRTNGLLEEFRSKTRQEPLRVKETDLAALIRTTTGEAAIPEHVEVRLQLGAGLEAVTMDPTRVHRVLDNLITNAVEAMHEGGNLTVTAEKENNRTVIKVSDTGVGIPDEAMANLFKPFQTTKKGGLGLGLAYCKRAVEDHGGTITVESKVGEGTTFTISLPLREE